MRKTVTLFIVLLLVASIFIVGCSETDTEGKVPKGEGDGGEGEPCEISADCDEIGEECVSGVCIYTE